MTELNEVNTTEQINTLSAKFDNLGTEVKYLGAAVNTLISNLNNLNNLAASYFNKKVEDSPFNKSFSQYGEDLILNHAKLVLLNKQILRKEDITYLDIGANLPKTLSNTYRLYSEGFNGILVEPNKILAEKLKSERPYDITLDVGISNVENECVQDFYQCEEWANSLSSFSKNSVLEAINKMGRDIKYEVIPTRVCNINTIMDKYLKTKTPFLINIDAEGIDYDILTSINFEKYKPVFFIIETAELSQSTFLGRKKSDCAEFLKQQGYIVYADTYINTVLIDKNILEKMY